VGAQMGRILEKLRNLGRVEKEGSRRRWTHRAFSVERAAAVRRTRRRRSNAQSVHAVCAPGRTGNAITARISVVRTSLESRTGRRFLEISFTDLLHLAHREWVSTFVANECVAAF